MRIVVIGAGFGGLSAAIRLQAAGHEVTVCDAGDTAGGRAAVFAAEGFTFDMGPTILTAPALLEELFAVAGRRMGDYVQLVPLDPFYNVRFDDGSVFRYTGDESRLIEEVRRFSPSDVGGYRAFAEAADRIFARAFPLIDRPFASVADMLRVAPDLVRLRADRSVAQLVSRHIRDPRLRQVFSFHPLLVGGNPFDSSAIYALIHALEKRWGVWFAMGGTGALVRALVRVFEELGGRLRLSTVVRQVVVDDRSGRASGVMLATDERLEADAVVSNADAASTYLDLVPARARRVNGDRRVRRWRQSMSLFVIYFGTNRRYEEMAHHEILMGPRYRGLLDDIFRHKQLATDFSLYLHRPTATDPSLAPPGCDSWYVLSPVPHLGGDVHWATVAQGYRDAIIDSLERRFMPGLSRHIVVERVIDPRYFRDTLHSHLGSAFSVEPVLTQSAWFRPHNRSEDVENLYLVGAGTHPGAGVPGVVASGKIVADLLGPSISTPPASSRRRPVAPSQASRPRREGGGRGEQPESADCAEPASGRFYPNEPRSVGTASVDFYRNEP
jgi:phytoene desaturase